MTPRVLLAATMLATFGGANAMRVLDPVESAVEVSLTNLSLPVNAGGTVTLRACAECPYSNHRMTDGALFRINRKNATFDEVLEYVTALRQSRAAIDSTLVTVFLDVNSERVTRISISRSAP